MTVQPDSDRTSVSPRGPLPFILGQHELIAGEVRVGQVIVAQPEVRRLNLVETGLELSAVRRPFNANVIISGQSRISVIDSHREANSYFTFDVNCPILTDPVVQTHPNVSVRRFSHLSKTSETWTVSSTFDLEATKSLAELRSIVSTIGMGIAPRRPREFEDLLGRALAAQGQPKDIEQWARRLAQDVSDLDD